MVALVGHILLIIAAVPGVIEHPNTAFGIFIAALIIMGVGESLLARLRDVTAERGLSYAGTGGFKANISPLVAEQYRGHRCFITTTKSGERVIVDPSLTISRIYMVSHTVRFSRRYAHEILFIWLVLLPVHQHRWSRRPSQYDFHREIRRLLPRIHPANRHFLALSYSLVGRPSSLRECATSRFRLEQCVACMASRNEGKDHMESVHDPETAERGRLLGERETEQLQGRGETKVDDVR